MSLNSKKTLWTQWIGLLQSWGLTANPEMSQYQIGSYMSMGSCHSSHDGMISSSANVSDERPSQEAHIGSWLLSVFCCDTNYLHYIFGRCRLKRCRMTCSFFLESWTEQYVNLVGHNVSVFFKGNKYFTLSWFGKWRYPGNSSKMRCYVSVKLWCSCHANTI